MAEFTEDFQSFIDPNMELINQFIGMNPHALDNSHVNMQNLMMPFSSDSFFGSQEHEFQGNFEGNLHDLVNNALQVSLPNFPAENEIHEVKKRKIMDTHTTPDTTSENSTPAASESGGKIRNNFEGVKRAKNYPTEEEKLKEVVHVRARRGQATDSHSIAERVRRGKINDKLRCLQNIVPGCYKTMSMSVMLDEIINYVQSLQNQVEFLSLKLTAASTFHGFSSETDTLETMQRAKASEAKELGNYEREGYGRVTCFQPTWPI
ncbi:hypothetical protein Lal_00046282 [Lupinus albus]|uniref:Putative transcription factor bHLH family n=1 Tax=Lupinus albus TaxID=3870 RepID=A0A6A4PFK9_LUPAL|nr:putative transcription factor bHLH family [Lupinus albus]KAF1887044.1 hypothetical protein Lal_00046282 [Lupinus albus]